MNAVKCCNDPYIVQGRCYKEGLVVSWSRVAVPQSWMLLTLQSLCCCQKPGWLSRIPAATLRARDDPLATRPQMRMRLPAYACPRALQRSAHGGTETVLQHCEGSQRHADNTSTNPFLIFRSQCGFDEVLRNHIQVWGMHRKHKSNKLRTTSLLRMRGSRAQRRLCTGAG